VGFDIRYNALYTYLRYPSVQDRCLAQPGFAQPAEVEAQAAYAHLGPQAGLAQRLLQAVDGQRDRLGVADRAFGGVEQVPGGTARVGEPQAASIDW